MSTQYEYTETYKLVKSRDSSVDRTSGDCYIYTRAFWYTAQVHRNKVTFREELGYIPSRPASLTFYYLFKGFERSDW